MPSHRRFYHINVIFKIEEIILISFVDNVDNLRMSLKNKGLTHTLLVDILSTEISFSLISLFYVDMIVSCLHCFYAFSTNHVFH